MEAAVLELQLPNPIDFPSYALVLVLALSFGSPGVAGAIQPINYSGSGRIAAEG